MSGRRGPHEIVDELPEALLDVVRRLLVERRDRAFDEDPDAEEAAESDRARRDYLSGDDPGESLDRATLALLG